jgi:hypothetical protein
LAELHLKNTVIVAIVARLKGRIAQIEAAEEQIADCERRAGIQATGLRDLYQQAQRSPPRHACSKGSLGSPSMIWSA